MLYEIKKMGAVEYVDMGDYVKCFSGDGIEFFTDMESLKKICNENWFISSSGGRRVVAAYVNGVFTLLHRYLLGLKQGDPRVGDHILGNPLDNRSVNLRVSTRARNSRNRVIVNEFGVSGIRRTKCNTFHAEIWYEGSPIDLGTYKTAEEAVKVRVLAEIDYFKEDAPFVRNFEYLVERYPCLLDDERIFRCYLEAPKPIPELMYA